MDDDTAIRELARAEGVAAYKLLLKRVLDNRPSGTRQRLAQALGKNRSFVSQIANPALAVPIPAQHIEAIFEVCHFAVEERRAFLDAYRRAHPSRRQHGTELPRHRTLTVTVPDLVDPRKNKAVDDMVADFARRIARLTEDLS
ncbi:hypothetical protein [Ancylobacter terrae]|uniref:hypothetical protein n=1 Tax=Ancylobacter sp. sgz301288 TaxID=3342077 RepID=UPI00385A66B9